MLVGWGDCSDTILKIVLLLEKEGGVPSIPESSDEVHGVPWTISAVLPKP